MRPPGTAATRVAIVAVLLLAGCSATSTKSTASTTSTPASSTTSATTTTSPATASTSPAKTKVTVAVVLCPTTYAVPLPSTSAAPPSSEQVAIPSSLAGAVALYSDSRGFMELLGPKAWTCTAAYGADGSGGVVVSPSGETVPEDWGAGWHPAAGSSAEAIVGSETSACQGCGLDQACPLFSAAAHAYQSQFGRACPRSRPASESVEQLSAGVVGFEDPAGVDGDGSPSGGLDPANGVMTYYPGSDNGSWIETCTLPDAEHTTCTAALNAFTTSYGQL